MATNGRGPPIPIMTIDIPEIELYSVIVSDVSGEQTPVARQGYPGLRKSQ
jgi:hypothetical protein